MTGQGVPPLDNSEERPDPYSLRQALEHAYYQRDVEALRRIAGQAEHQIATLRARLAAGTDGAEK